MKFTHLHVHSHYSLLDGLAKIDELIARAAELEMDSLALTDHGNLYGAIEFYQKAKKEGIKPILGCEMYVAYEGMRQKRPGVDDQRYHLTLLAQNNEGYKNLIQLVALAHLEGFYYKPRIDKEALRRNSRGLIALSGCFAGEIPRALRVRKFDAAERLAGEYQEILGKENFYLELSPHLNYPDQRIINEGLLRLGEKTGAKLVATNDVHYVNPEDSEAQDILVSVQTGSRFDDEDRLTMRGANLSLRSGEEMRLHFADHPEAIASSREIAERVNIEIEFGRNKLPSFPVPSGHTADFYLRALCLEGLKKRYTLSGKACDVSKRLEYELRVIQQTGFASYFLIVQDFVNWAKQNGIVVGPGRGSAAGSLVSYLLGITDIDPLKYNLLFERFLNPDRVSLPDIDLDFNDTRRDEVIEYVGRKYGRERVAQIITFGTMAARQAIRDAGRALGMPYSFCDKIAKMIPFNPTYGEKTGWLKKCLQTLTEFRALYDSDLEARRLIDSAMKLEGVARHASTHACGVVISPDPLVEHVPLQYAVKHGESRAENGENQVIVTQYDMHSVENLGLLKMDFLGLRNLTIIENTLKLIEELKGKKIDMDKIPLDDLKTFELFQRGETRGLFQFESAGMQRYLRELKPSELEDLIAMVALYRPGPMELISSYIRRKHGQERVDYLHPKMEPLLKNTYGVCIYQEQLMQMARDLAGFTLPEADILRKAVGKKIKKLLAEQEDKMISGMIKNNISEKTARSIWELVPPFARYAFNRSHAACYALIAYKTGYLKAHYPTEFMTALLAAEGANIEKAAFFIEEAKSMGIEVLAPDINESFESFTLVGPQKIRFGLGAVKNVGSNIVAAIIEEREARGKFRTIAEFAQRIKHKDFNKKSLEALIKCGALDKLGERNQLLSNLDRLLEFNRELQRQRSLGQVSLFGETQEISLSAWRLREAETAGRRERLSWEKEHLGLYVTEHPLSEYVSKLKIKHLLPLKDIALYKNNNLISVAGIVLGIQKVITRSGEPMLFVKLEDLSSRAEVLVFPKILSRNPGLWQEEKVLLIRGRMSDKDGVPKILCEDAVEIA